MAGGKFSSALSIFAYRFTNKALLDSFVEYETSADLRNAVDKLDGREFKGQTVRCVADVCILIPVMLQ